MFPVEKNELDPMLNHTTSVVSEATFRKTTGTHFVGFP